MATTYGQYNVTLEATASADGYTAPGVSGTAMLYVSGSGTAAKIYIADGAGTVSNPASVNIDALSALGSADIHQTADHFMFSDAGTEKKITFSNLQDAVFADVSGDATIAAGGALTLADNSVDSDQYVDGSIDNAHLAANSVDSDNYVDGSIDNDHLAANSVDSDNYVDGSIDLAHLAADSVDGTKIADDAIDSEHYTDGSIDLAHLAADSVDGTKIADDAIDSEHYVDGSIDNAHLADNAVDTDEIADNAVTLAKMAGLVRGKIIYGDASGDPAALAVGGNGKILVADVNGDPSWTTVSGDATLSAGALTVASAAGNFTVTGDLIVNGTTTTIDTANLRIEDSVIELSRGTGNTAGTRGTNSGAGFFISGSTTDREVTLLCASDGGRLKVSGSSAVGAGFDVITGGDYAINGTSVLNATTLGGAVIASSLTSLGTIGSLVATTADINAGTVDATIGATTPAAASFTTVSGSGNMQVVGTINSIGAIASSGSVTCNAGLSVKNGDTGVGFIRFYEDSDQGSNYMTMVVQDSLGGDGTITVPGVSNDTIVCRATTDTLTNKTLTSPVLSGTINSGAAGGSNGTTVYLWGDSNGTHFKWDGSASGDEELQFWRSQGAEAVELLTIGNDHDDDYMIDVATGDNNTNKIRAEAFVTHSDERLKKDIRPMTNAIDKINRLQGVTYNLKSSDRKVKGWRAQQIGFLAQDVKKVLPQIVAVASDGGMGIDYSKLTAVLTEAVKHQDAEIKTLRKTLSTVLESQELLLERLGIKK